MGEDTSIRLPRQLVDRLQLQKARYQTEHNIPKLSMADFLEAIILSMEIRK